MANPKKSRVQVEQPNPLLPQTHTQRLKVRAGFFGASSIERLPTERATRSQVELFKNIRLKA